MLCILPRQHSLDFNQKNDDMRKWFWVFLGSLLHWWIEDILLETNASGHNDKSRRILRKKYTYHLKSWNWSSWRIGYVCQKGCWMPKQSLLSVMTTDILVSDIFLYFWRSNLVFCLDNARHIPVVFVVIQTQ